MDRDRDDERTDKKRRRRGMLEDLFDFGEDPPETASRS